MYLFFTAYGISECIIFIMVKYLRLYVLLWEFSAFLVLTIDDMGDASLLIRYIVIIGYLGANKLVLLDVPYIGSENTCAVTGYKYQPFHKKISDFLQSAKYSFLYYCRSTPPKSDSMFNTANAEHIMKMKLAQYFMDKGYYFQKVRLDKDIELMVSNRQYDTETQFQWVDIAENII